MTAHGPDPALAALHAIVQGRVQGVGFRYAAYYAARRLGIKGWIRNLENGDVEVLAEGSRASIEAFESWLGEGPPGARVEQLLATSRTPSGAFSDFEIEPW
jgi:acylphosphatase